MPVSLATTLNRPAKTLADRAVEFLSGLFAQWIRMTRAADGTEHLSY